MLQTCDQWIILLWNRWFVTVIRHKVSPFPQISATMLPRSSRMRRLQRKYLGNWYFLQLYCIWSWISMLRNGSVHVAVVPRFGIEQEFTLLQKDVQWPLGWPIGGYPGAQVHASFNWIWSTSPLSMCMHTYKLLQEGKEIVFLEFCNCRHGCRLF